ncbi:MAG: hypothetical protein ACRDMZ_19435, partial [Solirubrobacteraceae bacterium]
MDKLMQENRRQLGNLEDVDFADESQIEAIRKKIDVDTPMHVLLNRWEYGSVVSELRALYEKGKDNQWNASHDVDWSIPVTNDDWLGSPELSMLASVAKLMG